MLIKNHKLTKEDEIEKIRIINDYCYLGINIDNMGSISNHLDII